MLVPPCTFLKLLLLCTGLKQHGQSCRIFARLPRPKATSLAPGPNLITSQLCCRVPLWAKGGSLSGLAQRDMSRNLAALNMCGFPLHIFLQAHAQKLTLHTYMPIRFSERDHCYAATPQRSTRCTHVLRQATCVPAEYLSWAAHCSSQSPSWLKLL